jgi:hypothetical protein
LTAGLAATSGSAAKIFRAIWAGVDAAVSTTKSAPSVSQPRACR